MFFCFCTIQERLLSVRCGCDPGPHYYQLLVMLVIHKFELMVTLSSKWLWMRVSAENPKWKMEMQMLNNNIRQVLTSFGRSAFHKPFFLFTDFLSHLYKHKMNLHIPTVCLQRRLSGKDNSTTPQGIIYYSKTHRNLFHLKRSNMLYL